MAVQPAAFLRTTRPLDLTRLKELDSGRYHSIWLPDHMVSFWPDSIWTPDSPIWPLLRSRPASSKCV